MVRAKGQSRTTEAEERERAASRYYRQTTTQSRIQGREGVPVKGGEKRRPECKLELELDSGEIDTSRLRFWSWTKGRFSQVLDLNETMQSC
jgi:hypothetical protein